MDSKKLEEKLAKLGHRVADKVEDVAEKTVRAGMKTYIAVKEKGAKTAAKEAFEKGVDKTYDVLENIAKKIDDTGDKIYDRGQEVETRTEEFKEKNERHVSTEDGKFDSQKATDWVLKNTGYQGKKAAYRLYDIVLSGIKHVKPGTDKLSEKSTKLMEDMESYKVQGEDLETKWGTIGKAHGLDFVLPYDRDATVNYAKEVSKKLPGGLSNRRDILQASVENTCHDDRDLKKVLEGTEFYNTAEERIFSKK